MELRKYHREELDTTDEIVAEFQKLRNEACSDHEFMCEQILENKKRIAQLEQAPDLTPAKKVKAKKSSAKKKKK